MMMVIDIMRMMRMMMVIDIMRMMRMMMVMMIEKCILVTIIYINIEEEEEYDDDA